MTIEIIVVILILLKLYKMVYINEFYTSPITKIFLIVINNDEYNILANSFDNPIYEVSVGKYEQLKVNIREPFTHLFEGNHFNDPDITTKLLTLLNSDSSTPSNLFNPSLGIHKEYHLNRSCY